MQDPTGSRKREPAQPTDLADKFVAFKRRQAAATKPREKADRPSASTSSTARPAPSPRRTHAPPLSNPSVFVSQAPSFSTMEADADDFSRRLKISPTSPRASHSRALTGSSGSPGKLYNPNADNSRRPLLTAEPDAMSDVASSSHAPRGSAPHGPRPHPSSSQSRTGADSHRQLFDHRKDDPVRFSVLTRPQTSPNVIANRPPADRPTPTPKSSIDYVSASSTSSASYAQSTLSSNFTLSSTTTDSSAPSALFENPNARRSEDSASGTNAFSAQLKKLYRAISALEAKILGEDREKEQDEEGERDAQRVGVLVKGGSGAAGTVEVKGGDDESEHWRRLLVDHKDLAEKVHHLLRLTLAPTVPASLRNIPVKYNLTIRLWTHAFHRLLESLRRAASPPNNSVVALEYLQEFIYYAYVFYTGLLEERNLSDFRNQWVEALGDLARYRMATCALLENQKNSSSNLTVSAVAKAAALSGDSPSATSRVASDTSLDSDRAEIPPTAPPVARIDDESRAESLHDDAHLHQVVPFVPSVGIVAARQMELEPEKERWRQIAREWFARGLIMTPGAGKLHHHLGILCREGEGSEEELRGMYHFVKSMIALHPFTTAREAILQLWSPQAQMRRQAPDAGLTDLFVMLHGMLFTKIQLDDFRGVLERFEEKLHIEGGTVAEERDWIMMAIVNLACVLEYGRPDAMLRRAAGFGGRDGASGRPGVSPVVANAVAGKVKLMAKKSDDDDKKMDVDDEDGKSISPAMSHSVPELEIPHPLKLGMQLAFSILSETLRTPMRKDSPIAPRTLNPYITVVLTFLATVLKDTQTLAVLERAIPWEDLAAFLNMVPRRIMFREQQKERGDATVLLTSGCRPMPEDWCIRGLGWGGKRVYPMGFWGKEANSEELNIELKVLDKTENGSYTEGIIEEDADDAGADLRHQEVAQRWIRVARAGLRIAKYVEGFEYIPTPSEEVRGRWKVGGVLAAKVAKWQEDDRRKREEDERRLRGRRWDEDSMDVDDDERIVADESTDESEDDEEDSPEVKALKARRRYLKSLLQSASSPSPSRLRPSTSKALRSRPSLRIVPGYTVLVVDTNILLSSLAMISKLVESLQWTIVLPLPVIMELDGLATNESPLGEAARSALDYITRHFRSHSMSLKVQTSRGNYLSTLSVRTEQVDFAEDEASWERNMDDLILRAAIWQDEHWVDRSAMLNAREQDTTGAAKVVLLSFDRMLRLKARSRQLSAANERDLASILAAGR